MLSGNDNPLSPAEIADETTVVPLHAQQKSRSAHTATRWDTGQKFVAAKELLHQGNSVLSVVNMAIQKQNALKRIHRVHQTTKEINKERKPRRQI